jgi:hypothetical protein
MAEAALRVTEPPLHLSELHTRARIISREQNADFERVYLALRVQAYQREMAPLYDLAAKALNIFARPPAFLGPDGKLVVEPLKLPESTQRMLEECAATLRRHYELETAL